MAKLFHLSVLLLPSAGPWFLFVCLALLGGDLLDLAYLYELSECSSENGKLFEFGEILTAIFC